MDTFEEIIGQILKMPQMFQSVRKDMPNIRKAIITKYSTLIYEIFEEKIVLLSFWNTRKDAGRLYF